jgi:hypothetical protein
MLQVQTLMCAVTIALTCQFATAADPPTRRSVVNAPYGKKLRWAFGIYEGPSPTDLAPSKTIRNPVFTIADVAGFSGDVRGMVAVHIFDPFVIQQGTRHYLFFELCGFTDFKYGCDIAYASSDDGLKWSYEGIVLDEPFKLSYPNVFRHGDQYYMIPESNQDASVRLYEAVEFPRKWKLVKKLLTGHAYQDPTIFRYRNRWWILATPGGNAELSLYFADSLIGPWQEHPQSPIVENNGHIARPAGRVIVTGDRIIRFAQDCDPDYGIRVFAFQITKLSTEDYEEVPVKAEPVIGPDGKGWNADRMHHVDAHLLPDGKTWRAYVDGGHWRPVQLHGVEPL